MMLCLALRAAPERVYERALRQFTDAEISEAFAAARGLALPSQLRHALRAAGRDIRAEFLRLLPAPLRPVRIQRWSTRRAALLAGAAAAAFLLAINIPGFVKGNFSSGTSLPGTSLGCRSLEGLWVEAQSASAPDGVRRFVARRTASSSFSSWYDLFPGGCVTIKLRSSSGLAAVDSGLPHQAMLILGYVSRSALQRALRQQSGGRLHLIWQLLQVAHHRGG